MCHYELCSCKCVNNDFGSTLVMIKIIIKMVLNLFAMNVLMLTGLTVFFLSASSGVLLRQNG